MDKIILEGFRSIKDHTEIDIKPITILTGRNNSGKSTIIKALLFLSDYIGQPSHSNFYYDGQFSARHKLYNFDNTQNWNFEKAYFRVGATYGTSRQIFKFIKSAAFQTTLNNFTSYLNNKLVIEYKISSDNTLALNLNLKNLNYDDYYTKLLDEALKKKKKELISEQEMLSQNTNQNDNSDFLGYEIDRPKYHTNDEIQRIKQKLLFIDTYLSKRIFSCRPKLASINHNTDLTRNLSLLESIEKTIRQELQHIGLDKNAFSVARELDLYHADEIIGNSIKHALEKHMYALFKYKVSYLGPNRTIQSRLYLKRDENQDINIVANRYAGLHLSPNSDAKAFLKKWLSRFNIGSDISVENIENTACSIQIINEGDNKEVNLSDKGYGAGQLTTILLQMALMIDAAPMSIVKEKSDPRPLLMIEEPEANLHPSFQSSLADLFTEVSTKYGIKLVIETHSEYLIRKLQVLALLEELDRKSVVIYYCDQDRNNNTYLNVIEILPDGSLSENFGKGFFDEAGSHTIALMAYKRKAKES